MHILKEAGKSNIAEDIIRGTKIGKFDKKEDDKEIGYQMFSEVHEFVGAACKLYNDGELTWDKAMDELSTVCLRMKGKEKIFKQAAQNDEKESGMVESTHG